MRRAYLTRDLIAVRKEAMRISGERAFQIEKQANAEVLKCLHIQGRRPVSEETRGRKGAERKQGPRSHRDLQVMGFMFHCDEEPFSLHLFPDPTASTDHFSFCTHFTCTCICHSVYEFLFISYVSVLFSQLCLKGKNSVIFASAFPGPGTQ